MVVKSLVKDYFGLKPVDVEIVFTTGLPQISILGLPDKIIQESAKRIQSALVAQGFQMPKAKQVLVNLWPREMRKSSLGVDLAIALGILAESGQKNVFEGKEDMTVYGELTLSGEVRAPKDIDAVSARGTTIMTGGPLRSYDFSAYILENLRAEEIRSTPREGFFHLERPQIKYSEFSQEVSELLLVTALGEHSLLLAGPPGSGKTSFVETVPALVAEPEEDLFKQSRNIARYFGQDLSWIPVVAPHHSTPAVTMLGGGVPPRPGQIVRAHGGVLILDELLEFDQKVQSSLRETLETGRVQIARGLQMEDFPSHFLTLATTNLCKCGEYIPGQNNRCRCSGTQLKRYYEKLTGPFLDRMSILQFTQNWTPDKQFKNMKKISSRELIQKAKSIREFMISTRGMQHSNEKMTLEEVQSFLAKENLKTVFETFRSHRRRLAFWRVARTFADLDFSEQIYEKHLLKSQQLTVKTFNQLKSF